MKKILFGIVLTMAAVSAQASYLYWTVDQNITMQNTGTSYTIGEESSRGSEYIGAVMYEVYNNEARKMTWGTAEGGKFVSSGETLAEPASGSSVQYLVDVSAAAENQSSYSYYIEYIAYDLATGENIQIGVGETKTYAQLLETGSIETGGSLPTSRATIWHGGTKNAPEPTSAMLMLLGVAGLALRRKQRKLA